MLNRSHIKLNPGIPGFTNEEILGFLFDCVMAQNPKSSLEIGSWMGRSASVICAALGCLGGERSLLCVDSFKQKYDRSYVQQGFLKYAMKRSGNEVRRAYTDFDRLKTVEDCFHLSLERNPYMNRFCRLMKANSLQLDPNDLPEIDFAYIDGDHTYDGVRSDCRLVMSRLTENGMVVFDDYYDDFPGIVQFIDELKSSGLLTFVGQEHHDIAFTVASPRDVLSYLSSQ